MPAPKCLLYLYLFRYLLERLGWHIVVQSWRGGHFCSTRPVLCCFITWLGCISTGGQENTAVQPAVKVTICWAKFMRAANLLSCSLVDSSFLLLQPFIGLTGCCIQKKNVQYILNWIVSCLCRLSNLVVFLSGLPPRFEDIALFLYLKSWHRH